MEKIRYQGALFFKDFILNALRMIHIEKFFSISAISSIKMPYIWIIFLSFFYFSKS